MITGRSLLVRQFSRRAVAEALLHLGPISRAELAKETGLSKQTMSEVMAALESEGWARPAGRTSGAVGRSALRYEVARDAAFSLGVDLGGTKVIAALADLAGDVVAEETEPTDRRGGRHVLDQIHALALRLAKGAGVDPARIRSVVIGSPGVVDPLTGAIGLVPNIRGLSDCDVPGVLGALFGLPVAIENDVNLAMLGEAWQGAARGVENAGFLALGTGAGLGLIVNGKLARGASGAAGEIAYLPVGRETDTEAAREIGTFELEVGAAGIVRRYREAGGAPEVDTVREVFARLEAGDATAVTVIDETARIIALAVTALGAIVDPEMIVFGGSIGIREELIGRVRAVMPTVFERQIQITASHLGARAGLVGAVSSAVSRLHNEIFGIPNLPGDLALPASPLQKAAE